MLLNPSGEFIQASIDALSAGSALGEGGQGTVYPITIDGADYAVKVTNVKTLPKKELPDVADRGWTVYSIFHELAVWCGVRSDHITAVRGVGMLPTGFAFCLYDRMFGGSLARRLNLPYSQLVQVCIDACYGLTDMHEAGYVHADLKPDNILLHTSGEHVRGKLCDLGSAVFLKGLEGKGQAQDGGTEAYCAEEHPLWFYASDVYAWGVTVLAMLVGPKVALRVVKEQVFDHKKYPGKWGAKTKPIKRSRFNVEVLAQEMLDKARQFRSVHKVWRPEDEQHVLSLLVLAFACMQPLKVRPKLSAVIEKLEKIQLEL